MDYRKRYRQINLFHQAKLTIQKLSRSATIAFFVYVFFLSPRPCYFRFHAARPISSTTQIWVVTRHQYGISALFLRRNLAEKPVVASPNVGCFLRLIYSFHQKRSNDYALLR